MWMRKPGQTYATSFSWCLSFALCISPLQGGPGCRVGVCNLNRRAKAAQEVRQRLYGDEQGYQSLLVEPGFWAKSAGLWQTNTEDKSLESWVKIAENRFEP